MGWPSCFENNLERAQDRALVVLVLEDRFRVYPPVALVSVEAAPKPLPEILVPVCPAAKSARIAQRTCELREIHMLCRAEMRPRAHIRSGAAHLHH